MTLRTIPIGDAVRRHFRDIGHDESKHDVTYENAQARERTQILMDVANQVGGFNVGTGDLSELALGWCTYNGDHMSMYHVNAGVPKTLVRYLVDWAAEAEFSGPTAAVLRDICATPITPELLPLGEEGTLEQKTEETIGPYELHDFFLYQTVRYQFAPPRCSSWRARRLPATTMRRRFCAGWRCSTGVSSASSSNARPCPTGRRSVRWRCRPAVIGGCPATPVPRSGWRRWKRSAVAGRVGLEGVMYRLSFVGGDDDHGLFQRIALDEDT